MKPRLTLEDIKQKLEPYNIIVLDDEYKNAHQDIHMICSCGKPFQKTWNNMSKKVKQNKPIHCRECANRKISQDKSFSYEYVKQFVEEQGYILVSTEYINAHTKIHMICPNGHDYFTTFQPFQNGSRCICETGYCNVKHTHEEMIDLFKTKGFEMLEEYKGANIKIKLKCLKCGGENYLSWGNVNGSNVCCIHCREHIGSHGELKIKTYLDSHKITYEQQKRYEDCKHIKTLPFDFYIPSLNMAIEYDGEQHFFPCFGMSEDEFKDRQLKDSIKTKYCQDNNIRLLRIPYTEFKNIENILDKELFGKTLND